MREDGQNPTTDSPVMGDGLKQSWVKKTGHAASGAAKVFREFKWGLLTLFLLMVVVIGLVYDGGKKKHLVEAEPEAPAQPTVDWNMADAHAFDDAIPGMQPNPQTPPLTQPLPQTQPGTAQAGGDPWNGYGPRAQRAQTAPRTQQAQPRQPQTYAQQPVTRAPARPEVPHNPPPVAQPRYSTENVYGLGNQGYTAPTRAAIPPAVATPAAAPPRAATAVQAYTVKSGDTLSHIAQRYYPGNVQKGVKLLSEANRNLFDDPRKMRVGHTLRVPSMDGAASATVVQAPVAPAAPIAPAPTTVASAPRGASSDGEYVVQAGDTLGRIASKVLNDARRWRELYEWNRDVLSDPNLLRAGMKLRIKKGDNLSSKPAPAAPRTASAPAPVSVSRTTGVEVIMPEQTAEAARESTAPAPMERAEVSGRYFP